MIEQNHLTLKKEEERRPNEMNRFRSFVKLKNTLLFAMNE